MSDYVPFSQRAGLEPVPPQLKLGEVSPELRRLVWYYASLEFDRETHLNVSYTRVFRASWERVAKDLHVLHFKQPIDSFDYHPSTSIQRIKTVIDSANFSALFNLIEFLVRHPNCSLDFKRELTAAFADTRAAYRIFDNQYIAAIGTEEQAAAVEAAITQAEKQDAPAARKHLISAGFALRNADWPSCVRESIHAVESVAVRLAPGTDTLGAALKILEQSGHLHGSLKAAFGALYGYSSDEKGIRHALVFGSEAKVDEADALFMLGACASFVSYLLARGA